MWVDERLVDSRCQRVCLRTSTSLMEHIDLMRIRSCWYDLICAQQQPLTFTMKSENEMNMTCWTSILNWPRQIPCQNIHWCICKCILYMFFCFKQLWNYVLFLPDGVPVPRVVRLKILQLLPFFFMRHFPMPAVDPSRSMNAEPFFVNS